jgi:hypothetical protein
VPAASGTAERPRRLGTDVSDRRSMSGLTFHGLRHSHKTWFIEDGVPDIAQARRLGHTPHNRMDGIFGHVAASAEARLVQGLEDRWCRSLAACRTLTPHRTRTRSRRPGAPQGPGRHARMTTPTGARDQAVTRTHARSWGQQAPAFTMPSG